MKKLFLYIAFFALIFWGSYEIVKNIYESKPEEFNTDTTETELLLPDEAEVDNVFVSKEAVAKEKISGEQEIYIVGIKNGYIVVYENTVDYVYEYTDIDAELIKIINPALYEELEGGITLHSTEEVFKILESISS